MIACDAPLAQKNPTVIRGTKVVAKTKSGKLAKDWQHFDPICAGESVALYEDGTAEIAPQDGCLLLPKADALIGEEWFYYGAREG